MKTLLIKSGIQNRLHESTFFLPEGGSNALAAKGCAEIVDDVNVDFDFICCACGTGATLAGIASALNDQQHAIGIAVLHGGRTLEDNVAKWSGKKKSYSIINDFHFGGYARSNDVLVDFCNNFSMKHAIDIEPTYTGKLFYGITKLIEQDYFAENSRIVIVHTGGVQKLKAPVKTDA